MMVSTDLYEIGIGKTCSRIPRGHLVNYRWHRQKLDLSVSLCGARDYERGSNKSSRLQRRPI